MRPRVSKELFLSESEKLLLHDFCKHTNIFYVMELILMWMPMQGIKFRDFISVVCTSNRLPLRDVASHVRVKQLHN